MTSSSILPSSAAGTHGSSIVSTVPPATIEQPAAGVRDGLTWVFLPRGAAVVESLSGDQWATPEAQGWERVKHNARREVWRADIRGQTYYLKYYFVAPWRAVLTGLFRLSACEAEWASGLFVYRAGIPAIRPVAYTPGIRRRRRQCALLITEAVEPAQPLDVFWRQLQADDDIRRRRADSAVLVELLAEMIARSHQAGFEHLDMHAANILVQPLGGRRFRTLFVDLQSARRGVPISDKAVVRNLAQLNQWFRKNSTIGDRLRFLRAYLRWRNEFEDAFTHSRSLGLRFEELVAALVTQARWHAQRLGARRDHRVMKDGRYFARLKLTGGWCGMAVTRCKHAVEESRASHMVFDKAWWQAQLADAPRWFASPTNAPGGQVCKDSHSGMVCRAAFTHDDVEVPVVIKRPRARNWRRLLAQLLSPSRSRRAWRIGHALLHRDVPTARPLAMLERRVGPFVLDSLLVTEAVPGACDLETYLREQYVDARPAEWARRKRELAGLLASHVRRLQERGFHHRDCKASNILVLKRPCLKLLWIDMDGLRPARLLSERRRWWPLVRLHVSLCALPGLTRTDRVRFLKQYFARFGVASNAWRRVWPRLVAASEEKARALAIRRAWKRRQYGRD